MKLTLEETYEPGTYVDERGNKLILGRETREELADHTGGLVAIVLIGPRDEKAEEV